MNCFRCGSELTTVDRPNSGLCRMCEEKDAATCTYSGPACGGRHVFIFSGGGTDGHVPDGTPCACGRVLAKWVRCEHCGQDKLTEVPSYPGHASLAGNGICISPNGGCFGCIPPEGCDGCEHFRPSSKEA